MTNSRRTVTVDWTLPGGRQDWLLGTGAVPAERRLVWAATAAATGALIAVAAIQDVIWSWWQWALVLALTVDVAGGVPANALATAKRFYHSPVPPGLPRPQRVARSHVGFAAVHVHLFVLTLLIPDATWTWSISWYLVSLAGTAAVVAVPLYLRRPLAAAIAAVALISAPLVDAPDGLAWLGPVLVLKLVAAHAVREEPYRPAAVTTLTPDTAALPSAAVSVFVNGDPSRPERPLQPAESPPHTRSSGQFRRWRSKPPPPDSRS